MSSTSLLVNRVAGAPSMMSWSKDAVRQRCSWPRVPSVVAAGRHTIPPTESATVEALSGTSHIAPSANIPTDVTVTTP